MTISLNKTFTSMPPPISPPFCDREKVDLLDLVRQAHADLHDSDRPPRDLDKFTYSRIANCLQLRGWPKRRWNSLRSKVKELLKSNSKLVAVVHRVQKSHPMSVTSSVQLPSTQPTVTLANKSNSTKTYHPDTSQSSVINGNSNTRLSRSHYALHPLSNITNARIVDQSYSDCWPITSISTPTTSQLINSTCYNSTVTSQTCHQPKTVQAPIPNGHPLRSSISTRPEILLSNQSHQPVAVDGNQMKHSSLSAILTNPLELYPVELQQPQPIPLGVNDHFPVGAVVTTSDYLVNTPPPSISAINPVPMIANTTHYPPPPPFDPLCIYQQQTTQRPFMTNGHQPQPTDPRPVPPNTIVDTPFGTTAATTNVGQMPSNHNAFPSNGPETAPCPLLNDMSIWPLALSAYDFDTRLRMYSMQLEILSIKKLYWEQKVSSLR